jgi:hypothetical protein
MSDRERWIVYPLIFLALGVVLRDKLTRTIDRVEMIGGETVQMDLKRGVVAGPATHAQIDFAQGLIQADTIRCQKLIVERELNARQTVTQRVAASEIVILGADRKIRVLIGAQSTDSNELAAPEQSGGQIVVFGPEGKAQVLLTSGSAGGEVAVVDKSLRLRLNFGGFEGGVMLEAETGSGEKIPLLSLPSGLDPTKVSPASKPKPGAVTTPTETTPQYPSPGPPEPEEDQASK